MLHQRLGFIRSFAKLSNSVSKAKRKTKATGDSSRKDVSIKSKIEPKDLSVKIEAARRTLSRGNTMLISIRPHKESILTDDIALLKKISVSVEDIAMAKNFDGTCKSRKLVLEPRPTPSLAKSDVSSPPPTQPLSGKSKDSPVSMIDKVRATTQPEGLLHVFYLHVYNSLLVLLQ